jgi:hypothetical protein
MIAVKLNGLQCWGEAFESFKHVRERLNAGEFSQDIEEGDMANEGSKCVVGTKDVDQILKVFRVIMGSMIAQDEGNGAK